MAREDAGGGAPFEGVAVGGVVAVDGAEDAAVAAVGDVEVLGVGIDGYAVGIYEAEGDVDSGGFSA